MALACWHFPTRPRGPPERGQHCRAAPDATEWPVALRKGLRWCLGMGEVGMTVIRKYVPLGHIRKEIAEKSTI